MKPKKPMTEAQLRQQANRNQVGEYQEKQHGTPGSAAQLSAPSPGSSVDGDTGLGAHQGLAVVEARAKRYREIVSAGYVPATTLPTITGPERRALIDEWHRNARLSQEMRDEHDGVTAMPDNYTPSKRAGRDLGGRSLENNLRTYRTQYRGDGMALRTFSRASIRAFTKDEAATASIPVEYRDGANGPVRQTQMKVERLGNGMYRVSPMDPNPTPSQERAAELIASELEGRRPAFGTYPRTGNLTEDARNRRLHEAQVRGSALVATPTSTWIKGVTATPDGGVGIVVRKPTTKGVDTYWREGSIDDFRAVLNDPKPGAVAAHLLRTRPEFAGVSQCGKCGRYASSRGAQHVCPSRLEPAPVAPGPKHSNTLQESAARSEAAARFSGLAARTTGLPGQQPGQPGRVVKARKPEGSGPGEPGGA